MAKPVDDQLIIYILYFQVKPNKKIKKPGSLKARRLGGSEAWRRKENEGEKMGR